MEPDGVAFLTGLAAVVCGLVAFALAALRWGADSRDGIDSAEWQRRRPVG
jgi:hypothetical protein